MPRKARLKIPYRKSFYQTCSKASGPPDWRPFDDPRVQARLLRIIEKYATAYQCEVTSFVIEGNQYELGLQFQPYRRLSRLQMEPIAEALYSNPADWPKTRREWQRFNRRIFDLSEFMRNVNGVFASWYNKTHNRRGPFFAERFKSAILADRQALQDSLLYMELHPVREGRVSTPENWAVSSASYRRRRPPPTWMTPLSRIFEGHGTTTPTEEYRTRLHWRGSADVSGNLPSKPPVLADEIRRGFIVPGVYLRPVARLESDPIIGSPYAVAKTWRRIRTQLRSRTDANLRQPQSRCFM